MGTTNVVALGLSLIMVGQLIIPCQCELFTALVHMEGLLDLEMELLTSLNTYITAEKQRLQQLEEFSDRVSQAHSLYSGKPASTHLHDPVNAFQLVNRYSNMWKKMHDNVYSDNSKDLMANISLNNYRLPTSDDFSGAVTALQRLQETYQLSTSSLATGKVGAAPSVTMTAKDCFIIGRESYLAKNWHAARDWMKEALAKYDEGSDSDIDLPLVYDHLAFSEYQLGNMKKATQYNRDLLQNEPNHERALKNMAFFENLRIENPDKFVDAEVEANSGLSDRVDNTERKLYEAACREGTPVPSSDHHKLVCYYFDNKNDPRLVLQPVKVEVLYPDPKIYVLRDFISEVEMARLKELAAPKLNRATVHDTDGNLVHATYRISKSGWLSPGDDSLGYVKQVDNRIEAVTGLTMSTAEQLQVVNYGIGGHYEPHYDFSREDEDAFTSLGTGNRIATLLIYMSDVELGGATVFPNFGLRIPPTKGDAAYWWNLKKSGAGDLRTRHAGCPVLVGSKWVCNKWIHERGQEFRRPCALSRDQ